MKALVLLLVGLLAGALCTAALVNALGKRNAHERAVMVVLARHMDGLRIAADDQDCAGPQVQARLGQVAAAASEMDYAFATWDDPVFARHTRRFQALAQAAPAQVRDCRTLAEAIEAFDASCRTCHRDFR